jgi:hypothetical protein
VVREVLDAVLVLESVDPSGELVESAEDKPVVPEEPDPEAVDTVFSTPVV